MDACGYLNLYLLIPPTQQFRISGMVLELLEAPWGDYVLMCDWETKMVSCRLRLAGSCCGTLTWLRAQVSRKLWHGFWGLRGGEWRELGMLATKGTHGPVHTLQMAVAQGPSNHLISDKDARNPHWRKDRLFNKCWGTGCQPVRGCN